ncbi:hypothetical protein [Alkalihalobacillus sp. CinArs1]|uniref:hypothetical protein n=1 Tax=Alkalihalobacillus sp. CinArs1 TaxID=2995314 RepID=UPI0022DD39B3|nr:hypothetical protein [Alkalihalobacillus sp. CinArs1]
MIKLGDRTFVSYITEKRVKVVALDERTGKLYINDEYKGRCDLDFILNKIKELELQEENRRWLFEDERKLYNELSEIIKNQIISSNSE